MGVSNLAFSFAFCPTAVEKLLGHQGEEDSQSLPVGRGGMELHSSGKQCCLIKALKALCLAFSRLSCSVSLSICSISFSIRSLSLLTRKISLSVCLDRSSISRTGRQLSVDKNCRHRGNDAGDAPWLGDGEAMAGEGVVVIGGEKGDQAEQQAADGLDGTRWVEARPGAQA